jgi:hypothetical protein
MLPYNLGDIHLELQVRAPFTSLTIGLAFGGFWHFRMRQWGGFMLDVSSSTKLYSNLIFHLSFLNLNFIPFMCL